jgi:hypothetical protein
MDDSNVPIFAQAKLEYTKQLVDVLYMNMYDGIRSIYDDSKQLYTRKATTSIIYVFRSLLEKVPKWNTEIIDSETERIMKASKCDWLDDLLTAVFISHTRILMSIGPNQNYNKINVTIPKTTTFIHKTYVNIAREVWKNPYLFNDLVPGHEYQRNMKQLEDIIKLTIEDTIRRQLPIKEILREHLETYDEPKQRPMDMYRNQGIDNQQKPVDMQMLLDELKKANSQNMKLDDDDNNDDILNNDSPTNTSSNDISFKKEDNDDDDNEETSVPLVSDNVYDNVSDNVLPDNVLPDNVLPDNVSNTYTDPYKDPNDPDESQIEKATQNIVLNDITEPVIEETYDNIDIVKENINNNDDTTKKLNDMMNELHKPTINNDITISEPPKKPSIKPVTTDIKQKEIKPTSVVKIDEPNLDNKFSIDSKYSTGSNPSKDNKPSIIKLDSPVKDTLEKNEPSSTFSFSNLYPNISGQGKVEDITKDEGTKKVEDITKGVKDVNASIMKEVITLDKKEEDVDDTITLDNFFTDVQKLSNPMEPIKEDESKYTLFEDASLTES